MAIWHHKLLGVRLADYNCYPELLPLLTFPTLLGTKKVTHKPIDPNVAVEFKESDKRMIQNTGKSLLKKQLALSENKHKK